GSVTVLGAVSPPGGDFSEPVTQNTLRIVKVLWALDASLADRRHFPAVHWLRSYSFYVDQVADWWKKNFGEDWRVMREEAMALLQKEAELQEIVRLVGPDALPEHDRALLESARMLREDFLQQFAFHEVDSFCMPEKQIGMFKIILMFHRLSLDAVSRGIPLEKISSLPVRLRIADMKRIPIDKWETEFRKIEREVKEQFNSLFEGVKS
ncbi:MAG: hypothetical protein QW704_03135, partial [Candidatus Hadarchaeales archaeon]